MLHRVNSYNDRDEVGAEEVIKVLQADARNHLLMTAGVFHLLCRLHKNYKQ